MYFNMQITVYLVLLTRNTKKSIDRILSCTYCWCVNIHIQAIFTSEGFIHQYIMLEARKSFVCGIEYAFPLRFWNRRLLQNHKQTLKHDCRYFKWRNWAESLIDRKNIQKFIPKLTQVQCVPKEKSVTQQKDHATNMNIAGNNVFWCQSY